MTVFNEYKKEYEKYQSIEGWRMGTIPQAMEEWCTKYSERICVKAQGEDISYGRMWEDIKKASVFFWNNGIRKGDRVILQLPNGLNFLLSFFGLMRIGAVPIMGLPAHRIGEIKGMIDTAAPAGYVCQDSYMGYEYREIADALRQEELVKHIIVLSGENKITDDVYKGEEIKIADADNLDIAFLSLSGGTTGMSKLIPRTHGDYMYDTYVSVKRCELTKEDITLVLLPLPHNFIIGHPGFLGTFSVGATLLLSEYPDMNEGLELIEEEGATFLAIVPAMAKLMLELLSEDDYDITSLRVVQIGGAFLEEKVAQDMINLKSFTLQQVFGTAEGLNTMTMLDDDEETIRTCQGRATSPYDIIRIADENDTKLPDGEYGELQIKGPYTIHGYYNYPDNDKCFTADGFYKTGDRAMVSKDGNLKLAGRITEMINKGGEKITPSEIEEALADYEPIKDCAVAGLPDEELGEKIAVFVVSDKDVNIADIRHFLADKNLASYKMPDVVYRLASLPLTKIGKVNKKELIKIGKDYRKNEGF